MTTYQETLHTKMTLSGTAVTEHEYMGHVVRLKDGRSVKIIGDRGNPASPRHQIVMVDLDGNVFECYHDDIEYVWHID